jgi:hypothetical protein
MIAMGEYAHTGETPYMIPGRMGKDPAKTMCRECPLRKDAVPGALGGYSPMMYLLMLHSPADVACHMSKGFQDREHDQQRSCTGVAAYRANTGSKALGHAQEATDSIAGMLLVRVMAFQSPNEFIMHHDGPEGARENWSRQPRQKED